MPTIILPARFQRAPYNGDYYKILGLNSKPSPRKEEIIAAYRAMSKIYHPDKISTSPVQPPLTITEATECFRAVDEIKSILLSNCVDVMQESTGVWASVPEDVKSADDWSSEEQLKAYILCYVRSERFCDYPKGTGPRVPGYWSYIQPGTNDTERGRSKFSQNPAIATSNYQVEVTGEWDQPLTVFDKSTRPFTTVSNPQKRRAVLEMIAGTIPQDSRDRCTEIYGNHVREKPTLASADNPVMMFKKAVSGNNSSVAVVKEPFVIYDPDGNNFVDGIRENSDNSFTIFGRNNSNQPRQLTLFQDGRAVGYKPEAPLGVVESQFLANRAEIFNHFDLNINDEIPTLATNLRLR